MIRKETILCVVCLTLGAFLGIVLDVGMSDSSPNVLRTPARDLSTIHRGLDQLDRRLMVLEDAVRELPSRMMQPQRDGGLTSRTAEVATVEQGEPPTTQKHLEFDTLVDTTSGPNSRGLADEYFLMSPAQARVRFGRPDRVNAAGGYENWIYTLRNREDHEYHVTLTFISGHLIRVRTPEE
jgi:hypothetical protein